MPTVTASADALTTVARALAHMREPGSPDDATEDTVQLLINAYSRAISKYTQRQFVAETAVSRDFTYLGSGMLSLAPYELTAVTSVTLYTDLPTSAWRVLNNQTVDQEADYRLKPARKSREGTYFWITLPEIGQFHPLVPEPIINRRRKGHQVTIVGDWGIAAVPGDVELACCIAVANAYRNPESFQTRQLGPLSFTEDTGPGLMGDDDGLSLPRDARALLNGYRRKSRG